MVRKANTIQKNFIVTSENVSVQCKNIMNSLSLLFFAFFVGIMTFLLALGLTGYANALICTAMLLPTIGNGIPVSSVGFIVGVYSIIKRFQSAADTAGHIAVAVFVSKSEKEIDTSVYLS